MHHVRHYQLITWQDHGVPANTEVLDPLLDVLFENFLSKQTTVVHCSAGIGRSGVLIALGLLVARMHKMLQRNDNSEIDQVVNLFDIVACMRRQRPGMVQTEPQYRFCLKAKERVVAMLTRPSLDNE